MQLYITEQGSRINKAGNHLLIQKEGLVVEDVLIPEVESMSVFGSVYPTTDVLLALLEKGVNIAYLSRAGHFKGRLTSGYGNNVSLRLEQFDAYRNPVRAFILAKSCVVRKLENGLALLDAYHRNVHNGFRFDERDDYVKNLKNAQDYDGIDRNVLRGFEGLGARIYFSCFKRCLSCGIDFPGREYRPSRDPVNALLSFGYSLVSRTLASLIENAGMDPMIGFLHEPAYGRNSLACDFVEYFRHPLVDRLVLSVFNKGRIGADDFERCENEGMPGQLYLKPEKLKTFLGCYEEFCSGPNRVCKGMEDVSWRKLMRMYVEEFRRSLMEGREMEPLPIDYDMREIA